MTKPSPAPLTAHDFLKTFAVIIMVIDHIGYYFFPEILWFRAIGRIGFPIWFYLVGHASGRDISPRLMGGSIFLLLMNVVVGLPLLPLNALCTIIILRVSIDRIMRFALKSPSSLWEVLVFCLILCIPTGMLCEYGTLAVMFAMFGYMVRHREDRNFDKKRTATFMIAISAIFLCVQGLMFGFSEPEFITMVVGTMLVCITLLDFKARDFAVMKGHIYTPVRWFMQFCGRRTLEIYVVHLLIFKFTALAIGQKDFALFNFHIF